MKKIIRNPKGNPSSLKHDTETMRKAGQAGALKSSERMRRRWAEQPEVMRALAAAASAAVPMGSDHPNAKSYVIYRPDGLPPIRGVKNMSKWVRDNKALLGYTGRPNSVHSGMGNKSGWRGWRIVKEPQNASALGPNKPAPILPATP